ncbi:2Fe-2S iron-sulfur cluster-binding protein [Aurantivibrio plasticivorans]
MESIQVMYADTPLAYQPGESLLEAATRANVAIPNSCLSGICQSCLVKVTDGEIPAKSQDGLSEAQKAQGYALACQLKPDSPILVQPADHQDQLNATVIEHSLFSNGVLKLVLASDELKWIAGQFISIWKTDQITRPYSIASLPEDHLIELHIQKHEHGVVSHWLHDEVKPGDTLKIGSARGECCYGDNMSEKSLLLIGTGTGLAPLIGIIKDALQRGHQQPIKLHIGARDADRLYLVNELRTLQSTHTNFEFLPILKEPDGLSANGPFEQADELSNYIKESYSSFQDWCVFLCGAPDLVRKLQRICFLNGASLTDIHADPFISN